MFKFSNTVNHTDPFCRAIWPGFVVEHFANFQTNLNVIKHQQYL